MEQAAKYPLATVTPKRMAKLKELGLVGTNSQTLTAKIYDISTDIKSVKELAEALFDHDFKDVDFEEFDLAILMEGYNRFFEQLWGRSTA